MKTKFVTAHPTTNDLIYRNTIPFTIRNRPSRPGNSKDQDKFEDYSLNTRAVKKSDSIGNLRKPVASTDGDPTVAYLPDIRTRSLSPKEPRTGYLPPVDTYNGYAEPVVAYASHPYAYQNQKPTYFPPCAFLSKKLPGDNHGPKFSFTAGFTSCSHRCEQVFKNDKFGMCIPSVGCRCLSKGFFRIMNWFSDLKVNPLDIPVTGTPYQAPMVPSKSAPSG